MIEPDVAHQACDDHPCRLPRATRLEVEVQLGSIVTPNYSVFRGNEGTGMDTNSWIAPMVARGLQATSEPAAATAFVEEQTTHPSRQRGRSSST